MNWRSRKKKEGIFVPFILSKVIFLIFLFYRNVYCIEYTFRIYILLHVKEHNFMHFFMLIFKIIESLQCILKWINITMTEAVAQRFSVREGVLRNFAKFARNHLYQSLFFNKVAGLRPATLLKKLLWHRCFPVSFAKFLRTVFSQNTSGRLLLQRPSGVSLSD